MVIDGIYFDQGSLIGVLEVHKDDWFILFRLLKQARIEFDPPVVVKHLHLPAWGKDAVVLMIPDDGLVLIPLVNEGLLARQVGIEDLQFITGDSVYLIGDLIDRYGLQNIRIAWLEDQREDLSGVDLEKLFVRDLDLLVRPWLKEVVHIPESDGPVHVSRGQDVDTLVLEGECRTVGELILEFDLP